MPRSPSFSEYFYKGVQWATKIKTSKGIHALDDRIRLSREGTGPQYMKLYHLQLEMPQGYE